MSHTLDKGLFQKLRKPLPDNAALPKTAQAIRDYKDMLLPVSAIALVSMVILAPEFMQKKDYIQHDNASEQSNFYQISLPKAEGVKTHQVSKNAFSYQTDSAESELSAARIASDNMQFEKAFMSYNKAAQIYFDEGRFAQAKALTNKALSLLQNHIQQPYSEALKKNIIAFWGLQALNEKELGAADDALYAAQKTFDHVNKFYGSDHLETAFYYDFLGSFYQNKNDIMNALHCQYAALQIYKKHNHFDTGNFLIKMNNLGEHYRLQKSYDNAEKIISETIYFIENKYGSDVPELAVPLNNLGLVKFAKQERTKAEAYLMRAYQISHKYQSAGHDVTGYIASNLERVQKGTSL